MELRLLNGRYDGGYVSSGSCWKKGEIRSGSFEVRNADGEIINSLNEIAAYWPDGSVKWARHTFSTEAARGMVTVKAITGQAKCKAISITDAGKGKRITTGDIALTVCEPGSGILAEDIVWKSQKRISHIRPVIQLERVSNDGDTCIKMIRECTYRNTYVEIVKAENGVCIIKFSGELRADDEIARLNVWMTFGADSDDISFEYTFIFNGEAERDFIKGAGLCFKTVMKGPKYNHHIKIGTDRDIFHEEAMYIKCEHPRTPKGLPEHQAKGLLIHNNGTDDIGKYITEVEDRLPVWDRYLINQGDEESFVISKQTHKNCSAVKAVCGRRAPGVIAVGSENGSILVGIKDFWQRNPSALEADGISHDEAAVYAWFKSPYAQAIDFRHYDVRAYRMECNEGYSEPDPYAKGIAFTSECFLRLTEGITTDEELTRFKNRTAKNAVYVATPEFYHEKQAFGRWSLPNYKTETSRLLEQQMDAAIDFYKHEIDNRGWYGLLDYGDIMHTYDYSRHKWFYDFGGWAWQNTELVPTYWLWLYFIRTGREDVYTLAEAMSRHTSETDMYHLDKYKGLGSRHNVRHWGCPCKELRISMAGHHRPMYYLVGDRRIGDCMHDTADAETYLPNFPYTYREVDGVNYLIVRTGPDWAALVSDWMTEYERTLDPRYRNKILAGVESLKGMPLGLGSGPHLGFDPGTGKLKYLGEFTENIHLSVCMGGPEVWMEAIEAVDCKDLAELVSDYSILYSMSDDERKEKYGELIRGKEFRMHCLTSGIALAGAALTGNRDLAYKGWKALAESSPLHKSKYGFRAVDKLTETEDGRIINEISWISTGYVCQWCMNTLLGMEWCPEGICPTSDFLD